MKLSVAQFFIGLQDEIQCGKTRLFANVHHHLDSTD